jgi:hypothetical protein
VVALHIVPPLGQYGFVGSAQGTVRLHFMHVGVIFVHVW